MWVEMCAYQSLCLVLQIDSQYICHACPGNHESWIESLEDSTAAPACSLHMCIKTVMQNYQVALHQTKPKCVGPQWLHDHASASVWPPRACSSPCKKRYSRSSFGKPLKAGQVRFDQGSVGNHLAPKRTTLLSWCWGLQGRDYQCS